MSRGKIYIGTSGWHYSHWKGPFYPDDLPEKKFLDYYIQQFPTVEMNRTFYSLPKRKVFEGYAKILPRSFVFSVKASRFITHVKRLNRCEQPLRRFFNSISGLKNHLGIILFQLPPHWKINIDRLQSFLKILPKGHRYAFEFRDPSWIHPDVNQLLKKYHAAFCIYEFESLITPLFSTTDFIYVRLHGPHIAYGGKYSLKTLKKWRDFFRREAHKGKDIYCYFDNDEAGFAAINALQLIQLTKRKKL